MMGQILNEDMVTAMFRQISPIFPNEAIEVGSTWDVDLKIDVPMLGTMNALLAYRVDNFEKIRGHDCAKVAFDYTMEIEGESSIVAQMRETIRRQGGDTDISWTIEKSTDSGTMWIDRSKGMPVEMTGSQDLEMHMTVVMGAGDQANTMNMSMDLTQTQVLELVE